MTSFPLTYLRSCVKFSRNAAFPAMLFFQGVNLEHIKKFSVVNLEYIKEFKVKNL